MSITNSPFIGIHKAHSRSIPILALVGSIATFYFAFITIEQREANQEQLLSIQMSELSSELLIGMNQIETLARSKQLNPNLPIANRAIEATRSVSAAFGETKKDAYAFETSIVSITNQIQIDPNRQEELLSVAKTSALKIHTAVAGRLHRAHGLQRGLESRYDFGYAAFMVLLFLVAIREVAKGKKAITQIAQKATAIEEEANRLSHELIKQKTIDSITDLPNRLSLLMCEKKRHIALLDIKYFSRISGSFDRRTSEDLLLDFYVRLSHLIDRDAGFGIFRYDIDMAAVVAEDEVISGEMFIKKIRSIQLDMGFYLYQSTDKEQEQIPIKVIFGVATSDQSQTLGAAEAALATAKRTSGGIRIYQEQDAHQTSSKNYIRHSKQALVFCRANAEGRLVPYYQPIVDAQTLEPIKYEALARVLDSSGNPIAPSHFIPGVYYFGLTPALTETLFNEVWKQARYFPISINITITDIETPALCSLIFGCMARDPRRAKNITFEIVESEDENEERKIASFILAAKQLGSTIAVDDFGSGYSNFRRLIAEWDVDFLKIDGSIISAILDDPKAKGVVMGIVQIAKSSGIKTVAEFISNEEILEAVRSCGVDYLQGFHIEKPLPFSELEKYHKPYAGD
jgi:EAL domain-containing protein (putative c-di-GMP-specific phosphodiesterase class I)